MKIAGNLKCEDRPCKKINLEKLGKNGNVTCKRGFDHGWSKQYMDGGLLLIQLLESIRMDQNVNEASRVLTSWFSKDQNGSEC